MNHPSPQERKALANRYAVPKVISKWVVIQMGVEVYESAAPGLCENYITVNQLKGAYKKPVYK